MHVFYYITALTCTFRSYYAEEIICNNYEGMTQINTLHNCGVSKQVRDAHIGIKVM